MIEAAPGKLTDQNMLEIATFGQPDELQVALQGNLSVESFTAAVDDRSWALIDHCPSDLPTLVVRDGGVGAED